MIRILSFLYMSMLAIAADPFVWKQLAPLPDPLGVAGPFAGTSGNALLVAGGANFPEKMPWEGGKKVWHDRVWALDKPNGTWREVGKLPRLLGYGVSVSVNGSVLCIGGSDSQQHYSDVFALTWDGNLRVHRNTVPPSLPIALANAAGAVDEDGVVYVACGSTEPGEKAASDRVFSCGYRWKSLEWRELPPLPGGPRILPVAAASGDTFYIFGGAAIETKEGKPVRRYLRDAWKYTWKSGWQRLADLPKPSVAAASPAPLMDGKFLLISGDDGSRAGFQPVEQHPGFPAMILAYDPTANTWSETENTAAPRATLPSVEWNGRFIFPSGEVRPGVRSPEVWTLNK
jgi:N-acetylneuraminic acid mutarotase